MAEGCVHLLKVTPAQVLHNLVFKGRLAWRAADMVEAKAGCALLVLHFYSRP